MDYIPARCDLIALSFDPHSDHEQRGRRPALVISHDLFNRQTGLCIVCPITTGSRRLPLHVTLPEGGQVRGEVMVEQVKSIDFRTRRATFIDSGPVEVLEETLAILDACMF